MFFNVTLQLLYGGLIHVVFLFRFLVSFKFCKLFSIFGRFSSHPQLAKLCFVMCCSLVKISFDEDEEDNIAAVDPMICFMIMAGDQSLL